MNGECSQNSEREIICNENSERKIRKRQERCTGIPLTPPPPYNIHPYWLESMMIECWPPDQVVWKWADTWLLTYSFILFHDKLGRILGFLNYMYMYLVNRHILISQLSNTMSMPSCPSSAGLYIFLFHTCTSDRLCHSQIVYELERVDRQMLFSRFDVFLK